MTHASRDPSAQLIPELVKRNPLLAGRGDAPQVLDTHSKPEVTTANSSKQQLRQQTAAKAANSRKQLPIKAPLPPPWWELAKWSKLLNKMRHAMHINWESVSETGLFPKTRPTSVPSTLVCLNSQREGQHIPCWWSTSIQNSNSERSLHTHSSTLILSEKGLKIQREAKEKI